jgi:hypothetical protein
MSPSPIPDRLVRDEARRGFSETGKISDDQFAWDSGMKVIAAIEADFSRGALGTRSRLSDDLLGEPILRRTVRHVLAVPGVASVHVLASPGAETAARDAVDGLDVATETHDGGAVPWRSLIASARKWSSDAWRGGLAGATVFDESLHPWILAALGQRENADAVLSVPAAAPLLDPELTGRVVQHLASVQDETRMAFTQSAPGLSAAVYMLPLLADLAKTTQPICQVMAYHPAEPRRDMIMQPCFYPVDAAVAHASGRCIADTECGVARIRAVLDETGGRNDSHVPDALTVSSWLADHNARLPTALPGEVEIELTTEDPLSNSKLRPRGRAVGRRGPIDERVFDRLVREMAQRDDMRMVLGGFGDPLLHPRWPELVRRCRAAGIWGVAVRTPAVTLDREAVDVLVEARVDVLNVLIDAITPDTYRRLHNADHFDQVIANIERVFEAHRRAGQPQPLVVCEMIKTDATMDEMEGFYDHWITRTGSAVLVGPSRYAGQWPELAVMRMAPPARFPCRRVFSRAMVLADGRVTVCDQDFRGEHTIGSVADQSLSELWMGPAMTAVRQSHIGAAYNGMRLCPACEEWHRP